MGEKPQLRKEPVGQSANWILVVCVSFALAASGASAGSARSSESRPNSIGAAVGVANLQVQDQLVRGLRWNGIGGELRLDPDIMYPSH